VAENTVDTELEKKDETLMAEATKEGWLDSLF